MWIDALDEVRDRSRNDGDLFVALLVDLIIIAPAYQTFSAVELTLTSQISIGPGLVATWIGLRLAGSESISGF